MSSIETAKTALVVIDLQQGITAGAYSPYDSEQVISRTNQLSRAFREAGAPVIFVTVDFHPGFVDAPDRPCDLPADRTPDGPPPSFAMLDDRVDTCPEDLRIVKRQWGAFHGTELDLQLRRRGIDTLVLCGIATNMGVESTARHGWEQHYTLWFAEDAMSSFSADMHKFAVSTIFPRIGFVRTSEHIIGLCSKG